MRLTAASTLSPTCAILRIDHEDAVGAGEHADAAARAVRVPRIDALGTRQHVEVRRDLVGLELDLVGT